MSNTKILLEGVTLRGGSTSGEEKEGGCKPSTKNSRECLSGELSGDYRWDIAGPGAYQDELARRHVAEVIYARWAMLGVLGCIFPETLTCWGGVPFGENTWFKAQVSGSLLSDRAVIGRRARVYLHGREGLFLLPLGVESLDSTLLPAAGRASPVAVVVFLRGFYFSLRGPCSPCLSLRGPCLSLQGLCSSLWGPCFPCGAPVPPVHPCGAHVFCPGVAPVWASRRSRPTPFCLDAYSRQSGH